MLELQDSKIQKYKTPYRCPYPILEASGNEGAFDKVGVDIPFVFRHRDMFYMLYTGFDGVGYQSALAVSDDLLHWKHKGVILKRDRTSGRWDSVGGAATWIIKESDGLYDLPRLKKINGKYWMVYHSYPQQGYENGPAEIGMAWTEDEELLDWNFPSAPCFSWRDGAPWEAGGLYKACIICEKERYYMFYNAKDKQKRWVEQTGMAYSEDLQHWVRCGENPLLRVAPGSWEERFVSDPCLLKDGETWLNFYFGYGKIYEDGHSHAQEGLALSSDLLHWEKVREPILTYGVPGSIDCGHVHKASVVYHQGVLYHFYCGTRPHYGEAYWEERSICVAASQPVWERMKEEGK